MNGVRPPGPGHATPLAERAVSPPGSLTTLPQQVGRSWSRIPAGKTRKQRGGGHEPTTASADAGAGREKTLVAGQQ